MRYDRGSPTLAFVLRCVWTTPELLPPALIAAVSSPEAVTRPTFEAVATLGYVARLLRESPPAEAAAGTAGRTTFVVPPPGYDPLSRILPPSLGRHVLTRALSAGSALLASETLKLLSAVLGRAGEALEDSTIVDRSRSGGGGNLGEGRCLGRGRGRSCGGGGARFSGGPFETIAGPTISDGAQVEVRSLPERRRRRWE